MFDVIANTIISVLHFLVLFWSLVAPFTKSLRVSYIILMPFIVFHWIILDGSCVLTLIENKIRGCSNDESFVHKFVSKIYNVPDGVVGNFMWIYAIITWIYAIIMVSKEDFVEAFKI